MRTDIRPIQIALSGRGYSVGLIDGIATEAVYEDVLQFQRNYNMIADQAGVADTMVPKYSWYPSVMAWYKNRKRYHKRNSSYVPKVGDIIFYYNNELGRVAIPALLRR